MSRIDTLFKKIELAEITPPEMVWEKIEVALKEDDRKIIFWYSNDYVKVATILFGFIGAVGLFFFLKSNMIPIFNQLISNSPQVVYSTPQKIEAIAVEEKQILLTSQNNELLKKISKNKLNYVHENTKINRKNRSEKIEDFTSKNQSIDEKIETSTIIEKDIFADAKNATNESYVQNQLNTDESSDWELIEPMESIHNNSLETENSILVSSNNYTYEIPSLNLFKESFKPYFYLSTTMGVNSAQVYMNTEAQNLYFSGYASFNRKFGYQFGSEFGYQFNKKWSIESGMFYSQYIQTFMENNNVVEKNGFMYIDQLEFPLMARYSIFLKEENPLILSFKAGLMYGSVLQYQVNYIERELITLNEKKYSIDADKRNYNSLQLGYIAGIDLDAFVSKKVALHLSTVTSYLSQLENFPLFSSYKEKPKQLSTTFAVGMKFKF